jgi:hypothetical protein
VSAVVARVVLDVERSILEPGRKKPRLKAFPDIWLGAIAGNYHRIVRRAEIAPRSSQ